MAKRKVFPQTGETLDMTMARVAHGVNSKEYKAAKERAGIRGKVRRKGTKRNRTHWFFG